MSDEANTSDEKVSLARAQLPYKVEYCKTSRAKCKKCSEPMEANSMKLATMSKSRFHDGYDATFYHVKCFFQIKRPTSVAEIRHFETLKFEDQKLLEKAIETNGLSVLGVNVKVEEKDSKAKNGKKAKKRQAGDTEATSMLVNYDDFLVEYAKSNRAKCVKCEDKIEKGSVRLGKLAYDAETHYRAGPVPRWYHVDCFVKAIDQLEFYGKISKIKNFEDLEEDDKKMLKKTVKPREPTQIKEDIDSKKIKTNDEANVEAIREEKLLKIQSDRFFALREVVNSMKRKDLELLLTHMRQKSNFKAPSTLIDMATDVLLFGPLMKCPKCKHGKGMVLRGSSYICTRGSEEDPCDYETQEPQRDVPDIPDELMDKYPFFRDEYEFTGGSRIFPSKFLKAVKQKEAEDNKIVQDDAPLEGISIGVISWKGVTVEKTKVQKKVTTLGGKLLTALDKSLFLILSSEDQLSKGEGPKIEVAKALDIPFATADFLLKIEKKEDVIPNLRKSLLGDWKGDIEVRFKEMSSTK